jgi:Mn-dependent DtxR family transcriptional regulator
MEDNEKLILEVMKDAGKPVRPGDVAKKLNMESKDVSKIIQTLKKQGLVHSPKRCFWAPAE